MKKSFNPLLVTICFCFLLVFSCEKDNLADNTCNVQNPLKDLLWLKNTIQSLERLGPERNKYDVISMAEYNGETVFIHSNCDPVANSVFPVMDCAGELLGYLGEISPDSLVNSKVIWKSESTVCSFP
jgi:hypothetical protein